MSNTTCEKAPQGWQCTRAAAHDGPCAAVEVPDFAELIAVLKGFEGTHREAMGYLDEAADALTAQAATIAEQAAQIELAIPAMREYARKNPKHHFSADGLEQDPNGAHAWLARNAALQASETGGKAVTP